MLTYTLIRSRRKTAAIYITNDATVEVRAPIKMSKALIDNFVASKEEWIAVHLARRERLNTEKSAFYLDYGDNVTLCGRIYPILAKNGQQPGFDGECFHLPPGLPHNGIKLGVVQIYKSAAKQILINKTGEYSKLMNLKPTAVKITGAKTRWGSCSGKNSISFSWRLVMADESVIDYVVAHELAHIREHNHSARFWAIVESVIPDTRLCRLKLKELQDKLLREDWD